jgi:hypothetical protein
MTQESTDESPSVPEGFQGIMDKDFDKVHKKIYGDGDVDIPLESNDPRTEVLTDVVAPEEKSEGDNGQIKAEWGGPDYTYNRLSAYGEALRFSIEMRAVGESTESILRRAQEFANFLVTPLQ